MKFMIATHGHLATGVQSTLRLFLSDEADKIETIDAYVDDTDYTPQLKEFIESTADDELAIIFTDMEYGYVNQKVLQLNYSKPNVIAITGFNVPLLMEILMTNPETGEEIEVIIERAKEEMKHSVLQLVDDSNNGGDDFF